MNRSLRKRIFIPALFLLIVSVPLWVEFGLETFYSLSVSRYQISKGYGQHIIDHYPSDAFQDPPVYRVGKNTVEFRVDRLHSEVVTDGNGSYQRLGDIVVMLNGEEIDRLPNRILSDANPGSVFPVDSVYDDRSIGGVDAFVLWDPNSWQKRLIIMENISQGKLKKTPVGYNYVYPDGFKESQRFRMITVEADGSYDQEEYGYESKRTYLQTYLAQQVSGVPFGQYADWVHGNIFIVYSLVYPFGTGLLGFLLLPFSFRR